MSPQPPSLATHQLPPSAAQVLLPHPPQTSQSGPPPAPHLMAAPTLASNLVRHGGSRPKPVLRRPSSTSFFESALWRILTSERPCWKLGCAQPAGTRRLVLPGCMCCGEQVNPLHAHPYQATPLVVVATCGSCMATGLCTACVYRMCIVLLVATRLRLLV